MVSKVCIPTQECGNEKNGGMWMMRFIGDIPVRGIMQDKQAYWRFVSNGEYGMRSHAGAWERRDAYLCGLLSKKYWMNK